MQNAPRRQVATRSEASLATTKKMGKKNFNAIKKVVKLDTVTRYEVTGKLIISPEDYEEGQLVSEHRICYRADVVLERGGAVVVTPIDIDRLRTRLFEVLYQKEHGGCGARWHRNQDFDVLRIRVPRSVPKEQRIRMAKEAIIDGMVWYEESEDTATPMRA